MRMLLLVENDPTLLESLASALRRGGYCVLTAGNGEQALKLAAGGVPLDLVVLDVQIPMRDRLLVCRTMRSQCDVPVLMFDRNTGIMVRTSRVGPEFASQPASSSSVRRLLSCVEAMLSAPRDGHVASDEPEGGVGATSDKVDRHGRSESRPRGSRARHFPYRSPDRTHRP
jgi:CheY-like chemotaxis protein